MVKRGYELESCLFSLSISSHYLLFGHLRYLTVGHERFIHFPFGVACPFIFARLGSPRSPTYSKSEVEQYHPVVLYVYLHPEHYDHNYTTSPHTRCSSAKSTSLGPQPPSSMHPLPPSDHAYYFSSPTDTNFIYHRLFLLHRQLSPASF